MGSIPCDAMLDIHFIPYFITMESAHVFLRLNGAIKKYAAR